VGAVFKWTADRLVKQGHDLPNAQEVYSKLTGQTNVKLYFVDSATITSELNTFNNGFPDLQTIPGTMTLHQLFAEKCRHGHLLYRDVSCFCCGIGKFCDCYNVKTFQFQLPATANVVSESTITEGSSSVIDQDISGQTCKNIQKWPSTELTEANKLSEQLQPIITRNDVHLIGSYCIIQYDNKPYPGKILDINETDVTVECMHCIGTKYDSNRFFWPEKVKDICMYSYDDVLTVIPPPERISDHGRSYRHFRVNQLLWNKIQLLFRN